MILVVWPSLLESIRIAMVLGLSPHRTGNNHADRSEDIAPIARETTGDIKIPYSGPGWGDKP